MEKLVKFTWKWLLMIAAVVFTGSVLASCGDDDEDDLTMTGMVGIWVSLEDIEDGENPAYAIELRANGTGRPGEYNLVNGKFTSGMPYGRWWMDGDIFYNEMWGGETEGQRVSLSGDKLTSYYDDGRVDEVFVRMK